MTAPARFPDYSEWLTGDRLAREDAAWGETGQYHRNVEQVMRAVGCLASPRPLVVELGCGSGWMPLALGDRVRYLGIDKNPALIDLSRRRNAGSDAVFQIADLRDVTTAFLARLLSPAHADLFYSFSVLKHFALAEWELIFRSILALGDRFVLQLQTTDSASLDDGTEYHHTWINQDDVRRWIADAGCTLCWREETMRDGPLAESTFYIDRRRIGQPGETR